MFKPKQSLEFSREVTVNWPDGTTGTLAASYRTVPHEELTELQSGSDLEFLDGVLISPGPVGDAEGHKLPDDAALKMVYADTCAVSALVAEYINATKVDSFRGPKSKRRR